MKKYFIPVVLAVVLCSVVDVLSQGLQTEIRVARPDYTGKWKLNIAKSRFPAGRSLETIADLSWIMTISQKLPAISVSVRYQQGKTGGETPVTGNYTLFADGRGDEYVAARALGGVSATGWQNNKLIVTFYRPTEKDPNHIYMVHEFELSADGNTLDQTVRTTGEFRGPHYTEKQFLDDKETEYLVFDRVRS